MSFGALWSDLVFEGEHELAIRRTALFASSDFFLGDLTLSLGAGPLFEGDLTGATERFTLGPGWIAAGSASYNALTGEGAAPFVILSVTVGASAASSRPSGGGGSGSLVATDARVGVTVGKTLGDVISPYVSIRAFGGPVFWDDGAVETQGSDEHHYQPALGAVLTLPGGVDAFAEGAPFGERAVNAGLGFSY